MAETVLWDTSAFVALGNADDDLHEQAVQVSDALARAFASDRHFEQAGFERLMQP
jgi:hypothetical protein